MDPRHTSKPEVTNEVPEFVAHVSDDGRCESVRQHLHEVAEMARKFAETFGLGRWAYYAGLYHDVGKYSDEFQRRILENGPSCDHATAGARELMDANLALSYAVAGHHGGLPDGGGLADDADEPTLMGRLKREPGERLPPYRAFARDLGEALPEDLGTVPSSLTPARMTPKDAEYLLSFATRMVYSCLVDADYLCTERFMRGRGRAIAADTDLPGLRNRLAERLAGFYPPATPIDGLRCRVLDDCLAKARLPKGFFTLTVPTGGGKTLASLAFALAHACEHGMSRVVYSIPYTSIIEQNARVFRDVLGKENVLEHHGAVEFDDGAGKSSGLLQKLRLAAENWDAPLVVTTNVQLFESLHASKPSRCRKLHNLANAVIVLDEAQMLPTKQLLPCLRALVELVHNYGCTVVFCTATQPALNDFIADYGYEATELTSDVDGLFEALERVTYADAGALDDEELAAKLARERQVLCIVNSRDQARTLYELLADRYGEDDTFHLSTLLTVEDRLRAIEEIRDRLRADEPCRLVSTSLVEAGVDLDFPVVYRAKAGLDSLIQAAGRCNRNARRPVEESRVRLFDADAAYRVPADIAHKRAIARNFTGDLTRLDTPENVASYFRRLYRDGDLDGEGVLQLLSDPSRGLIAIPFRQASENFRMVEDATVPIIVPSPQTRPIIKGLRRGEASRRSLRRLSRHVVGIYEDQAEALLEGGAIETLIPGEDVYVLADEGAYDPKLGLTVDGKRTRRKRRETE